MTTVCNGWYRPSGEKVHEETRIIDGGPIGEGTTVSHGICTECAKAMREELDAVERLTANMG